MINTQKLIALAFSYTDGQKSENELSDDQREQAVM
jgi:hypothetical protein